MKFVHAGENAFEGKDYNVESFAAACDVGTLITDIIDSVHASCDLFHTPES